MHENPDKKFQDEERHRRAIHNLAVRMPWIVMTAVLIVAILCILQLYFGWMK
jgi:hypothetical protein